MVVGSGLKSHCVLRRIAMTSVLFTARYLSGSELIAIRESKNKSEQGGILTSSHLRYDMKATVAGISDVLGKLLHVDARHHYVIEQTMTSFQLVVFGMSCTPPSRVAVRSSPPFFHSLFIPADAPPLT